jgi:PAS domain S-box-containing protein
MFDSATSSYNLAALLVSSSRRPSLLGETRIYTADRLKIDVETKHPQLADCTPTPRSDRAAEDEHFRFFIEGVEDYAIFMLDTAGRVATWNAGAQRAKLYKASDIIGRHFSVFYSEEDRRLGKPEKLLATAAKQGRVSDEGWRVRKDGTVFWASVTITAICDEKGNLIGFGKVTRDLTERKQREETLRQSEERFRLLVAGVQDYAIFMLDEKGYVASWNDGAQRIKGYMPEEIIGQHFSRFYPEEDIRSGKPAWELIVAEREGHFEDEGWRIRRDGSRFWANVIITPVRNDAGKLLGFSKVTRDFTERLLARKALEESQARLKESEENLRDLSLHLIQTQDEERRKIGREIHDSLGQYLAALKMKLDLLETTPSTAEEVAACSKLLDQCMREVRTISYLLYPPMLDEIGLKSAIPWYLKGFSSRSGIETTFNMSEDFARLSRDAELVLFRVLQESLTNVQRHSQSKTAEVELFRSTNSVSLKVIDHGKGVPSAILEQGQHDWRGSLGVGLRGMSERLRQLGGSLAISSGDGRTEIIATIPTTSFLT